jgi:predicted PurR-regulated permease PerM
MAKARNTSPLFILVAMITALAALYFAKEILLPIALAILLSFLLTPLVDRLEHWRFPRAVAVILVVFMSFAMLGGLGWIVTNQLVSLSHELPKHEQNLRAKFQWLQPNSPFVRKVSNTVDWIMHGGKSSHVAQAKPGGDTPKNTNGKTPLEDKTVPPEKKPPNDLSPFETGVKQLDEANKAIEPPAERDAIPVRVVNSTPSTLGLLQSWLGPVLAPFVTAFIVVVLTLFMLLDREGQRSRLIQLFGRSHFHTTTEAVHDVAKRVSRYLRSLFLVNACYGFVIAVGLQILGVPSAMLWGVLAFVMRFLPYLGPWIAAAVPILISIATSSGWTQPLLVFGWYVLVELVLYNFIEPFVYGSVIGVSTVGILVAALFWTWLWGPVGLVLAMPMTVCLLVAARYVPQLRFLMVLLADEQPLSTAERVYQRLLAFDYHEPLKLAHKHLKESSLASFYDEVLIPALRMSEHDRQQGALNEEQALFVKEAAEDLVNELGDYPTEATEQEANRLSAVGAKSTRPSAAEGPVMSARILCVPLLDEADEAASRMLAQLLLAEGFDVDLQGAKRLTSEVVERVADSESDVVVISVLPPIGPRDSRLLWKRLRSRYPNLPIVVGFWTGAEKKQGLPVPENDVASRVATSLAEAVTIVRAMAVQQQSVAKTG